MCSVQTKAVFSLDRDHESETTSGGSFNRDQIKHVQNGGWMRTRGERPTDPKLGLS